jgi:hypothetical protein
MLHRFVAFRDKVVCGSQTVLHKQTSLVGLLAETCRVLEEDLRASENVRAPDLNQSIRLRRCIVV